MRKADFAEWLLSLTTTHERAASVAGDLQQESLDRGLLWFWASALRAASSFVWHGFREAPLRTTGQAVVLSLIQILYIVGITVFLAFVRLAFLNEARAHGEMWNSYPMAESVIAVLVASFKSGKWLARKTPQRELAVSVTGFVLQFAVVSALGKLVTVPPDVPDGDFVAQMATTAGAVIFTLAGIRRQRNTLERQSISR